jgi:hypothetical protein
LGLAHLERQNPESLVFPEILEYLENPVVLSDPENPEHQNLGNPEVQLDLEYPENPVVLLDPVSLERQSPGTLEILVVPVNPVHPVNP